MSKSANMLRTRRKDNNVKPNRRLDRKSSRGMLFENEELRLKTININAEVERGQSDIKKLKRENDQLRREIWYLRDEYDKLDKLLREKECQGPSSTSCTSESESCSTCSEESETVESSQNIENSQKTNLRKLNQEFDNLSIVPEENSTETSEKTSNLYQAQSPDTWNSANTDTDVIKPDQSYPVHKTQEEMPKYFFSPIKTTKVDEDYLNDQCMASNISNIGPICSQPIYSNAGFVTHSNYYPNVILPPLNKTTTDVIVKTDNQNFNTLKSQSSFSNGGNLEELLNDIETISHDILKMTHSQSSPPLHNCTASFPDYIEKNLGTNTNNEISQLTDTNINFPIDNYVTCNETDNIIPPDMPYKSELNVVLMPSPMQLIGIDKYKNLQKSCESLNTKSNENVSNLSQVLNIIPEATSPNLATVSSNNLYAFPSQQQLFQPFVPVPPMCPNPNAIEERVHQDLIKEQQATPPCFFEESSEYFTARYIPETSATQTGDKTKKNKQFSKQCNKELQKKDEIYSSKANLLDTTHSSDHISSENEDPLKLKNLPDNTADNRDSKRSEGSKSSKPSIRGKVSIHFKGKKDKSKEQKHNDKPKSPTQDRKHPIFDLKFTSETKDKKSLRKTPSIESKISNAANEQKTPNGESKASTSDNRNCKVDSKNVESSSNSMPELKMSDSKNRKSSSASPEHKQGHKESTKKCHRKHKKSDKNKFRKGSLTLDRYHRERSYSICTDRSNILDRRLGQYGYDEFTTSERERTNSLSSCDTLKGRELSNVSHFPTGKIPWCACWGNGCL